MFVVLFSALLAAATHASLPEENLPVPALVRYWGYPVETHQTVTKDGYYLTLHRIPHGVKSNATEGRPVVFLQHGLLCSSSNWVTNLPHQSLGFLLADAGYDVWLGNVRGNTYSLGHQRYPTDSKQYWDFSFEEMAKYDLPAMVSYALNVTGQQQLYYVGHSQGTMMAFAGLSENAELRDQIKVVYALAPVAHLGNTISPIRYFSYVQTGIKLLFNFLGIREFMPSAKVIRFLADKACPIDENVCDNVLFLMAGYDRTNMNETRTPVYFTHTPAGTSLKNMLHFAQLIRAERFQRYDYGFLGNVRRYGWSSPSVYDLTKVKNKVALISGGQDWLATPKDVSWLAEELPHVLVDRKIREYNHLDFIWGIDAHKKVYEYILTSIKKYDEQ